MRPHWEYSSKSEGIGGKIKQAPEEFMVEEILPDGTVLELYKQVSKEDAEGGKFVHFALQKKDWSTSSAINRIAKALHVGQKRFGYAGTKDKSAITAQRVSVFGVSKEEVASLALMDLQVNGAWIAKERVKLGELSGNRFRITWHGEKEGAQERVSNVFSELGGKFPNYFGPQRFGTTRMNTHRVGELLLRRQFKEAAMHFLAEAGQEEHKEAREARANLLGSGNFSLALKEFPKHLKLERAMLAHLANEPEDYTGAFRRLPRQMLLLFVHAFQSWLFNESLSARIAEGELKREDGEIFCSSNSYGFPEPSNAGVDWLCGKLLGYDSVPNAREKELLAHHGISLEEFRIKEMPEISSRGGLRALFVPIQDFDFDEDSGVFRFSLPPGAYATSALREFMKND